MDVLSENRQSVRVIVNERSRRAAQYGTKRAIWPGKVMATRKGAVDRRVQRSREALQRAHISLILMKDYDAITVQDICDAANVGRSTKANAG